MLFLDIDGVLNHTGAFERHSRGLIVARALEVLDPVCVAELNRIVEATRCEVVVSSTWRLGHTLLRLEQLLAGAGYRHHLLSTTPHTGRHRGTEIAAWLSRVGETGLAIWRGAGASICLVTGVRKANPAALVAAMIDFGEAALAQEPASLRELVVAIEDQRHVQRGKTERGETNHHASAVRDIQMLLMGAAIARGWRVVLIAPSTAKLAATGSGRATKDQVRAFVQVRIRRDKLSQNQADAVAVAMAGWPAYDRLVQI